VTAITSAATVDRLFLDGPATRAAANFFWTPQTSQTDRSGLSFSLRSGVIFSSACRVHVAWSRWEPARAALMTDSTPSKKQKAEPTSLMMPAQHEHWGNLHWRGRPDLAKRPFIEPSR
jgi:hypothetical protein